MSCCAIAGPEGGRWVRVELDLQPLEHDLLKEVETARRYVAAATEAIPDGTPADETAWRINNACAEAFHGLCERLEQLACRRARQERDYTVLAEGEGEGDEPA